VPIPLDPADECVWWKALLNTFLCVPSGFGCANLILGWLVQRFGHFDIISVVLKRNLRSGRSAGCFACTLGELSGINHRNIISIWNEVVIERLARVCRNVMIVNAN
jgi:hypothetical protein